MLGKLARVHSLTLVVAILLLAVSMWGCVPSSNPPGNEDTVVIVTYTSGSGSVTIDPPAQYGFAGYDPGTIITLTATPADGWNFSNWAGGIESTDNPVQFAITANLSIGAFFQQD
ncbi:MAG: hypothetical protein JXQ73_25360 [Phycisphaerae bacterium]|nr:hypothetical protein [Phycisphaerae bacterium]